MDRPTKVLIVGVVAGALVYGLGLMNSRRLARKIDVLQRACVAQLTAVPASAAGGTVPIPQGATIGVPSASKNEGEGVARRKSDKAPVSRFDPKKPYSLVAPAPETVIPDSLSSAEAASICANSTDQDPGIQGELAVARRSFASDWPVAGSAAIVLLCALPWAWYFLLRRIRELREAIVGR